MSGFGLWLVSRKTNLTCGVNPVSIHIDRRRKSYRHAHVSFTMFPRQYSGGDRGERTVSRALELLPAHLALQVPNQGLLVDLDADGFLVVAEEALESGGKLLRLSYWSAHNPGHATVNTRLLGALGLLR